MIKISIIIPVLNEEKNLPEALSRLQAFRRAGHEVIVVDGGSTDNSLKLAQPIADQVIVSEVGRARQMNHGAAVATGDVFLFLHSDTLLAEEALSRVVEHYSKQNYWGHFDVQLSNHKIVYRLIALLMNLRSRMTSIATGDQTFFIERKLFKRIAGFPEISLMEDIAISRILKQQSAPVCLKLKVITSSRRWEDKGVLTTVLLMWRLRLLYFFGVSPDKLRQQYYR